MPVITVSNIPIDADTGQLKAQIEQTVQAKLEDVLTPDKGVHVHFSHEPFGDSDWSGIEVVVGVALFDGLADRFTRTKKLVEAVADTVADHFQLTRAVKASDGSQLLVVISATAH